MEIDEARQGGHKSNPTSQPTYHQVGPHAQHPATQSKSTSNFQCVSSIEREGFHPKELTDLL